MPFLAEGAPRGTPHSFRVIGAGPVGGERETGGGKREGEVRVCGAVPAAQRGARVVGVGGAEGAG